MADNLETTPEPKPFDFAAFPEDTVFFDRRSGIDRRTKSVPTPEILEKRKKPERRGRIDPTTYDKPYTKDEIEFMTAMQRFITQSGKKFPSAAETLKVAYSLGYRRLIPHLAESAESHLVN